MILLFTLAIGALALSYGLVYGRKATDGPHQPPSTPLQNPAISLIICARNEAGALAENISRWLSQEGVDLQLILVNDHSTDHTADEARRLSDQYPNLTYVELISPLTAKLGKKHAILQGLKYVRHPLVAFSDADCWPATSRTLWLMAQPFGAPSVQAVLGLAPLAPASPASAPAALSSPAPVPLAPAPSASDSPVHSSLDPVPAALSSPAPASSPLASPSPVPAALSSPASARPRLLQKLQVLDNAITAVQMSNYACKGKPYMALGRNVMYRADQYNPDALARSMNFLAGDDDLAFQAMRLSDVELVSDADAHVYSPACASWGAWFRQKRRHYSVVPGYRGAAVGQLSLLRGAQLAAIGAGAWGIWAEPLGAALALGAVWLWGLGLMRSSVSAYELPVRKTLLFLEPLRYTFVILVVVSLVFKPVKSW